MTLKKEPLDASRKKICAKTLENKLQVCFFSGLHTRAKPPQSAFSLARKAHRSFSATRSSFDHEIEVTI